MNLYVWNRADAVTGNWHPEAGIVVIAATLERAREMIEAGVEAGGMCSALTVEPDLVRGCEGPEWLAVHPDAGCC